MSIRLKVTLATVAIAALGVGAADVTTFILLRGYFDSQAAASVRQVARQAVDAWDSGQSFTLDTFASSDRLVLVEVLSPQGKVLQHLGTSEAVEVQLPSDLLSQPGRPRAIEVPRHHGPAFEVIAVSAKGGTVVAAVSLKNEVNTLAHLFRLNFAVGGIVLAARRNRGAAPAISRRCLARIADTAHVHTRICGTVPTRSRRASGRPRQGDARDRGRSGSDVAARRGSPSPGAAGRRAPARAPSGRARRSRRASDRGGTSCGARSPHPVRVRSGLSWSRAMKRDCVR